MHLEIQIVEAKDLERPAEIFILAVAGIDG